MCWQCDAARRASTLRIDGDWVVLEYEKFPLFRFHKGLFAGVSIREYEQRVNDILHNGLMDEPKKED